jgi:hypothetical protein
MAVRGSFDLNERPATEAFRRMEREGAKADLTLSRLGKTVDDVFSEKNVAEAKSYQDALSAVERQGRETFGSLSRNAKESQYNVVGSMREMDRSVILLRENLDSLGRARATPKVDMNGVTEALAQIELLERRINALGRQSAHPSVSVPSALLPGAGGSGGSGSGSGGVPFAGSIPLAGAGAALAAAPPLIGGATGLIGSAGAAALGAGALGLTGFAVGGTAAALAAPTTILAVKGMKEASKALAEYQKQVIKTGPNSKASAQALRQYNTVLGQAPAGTQRFLRDRTALGQEFRSATRPAQGDVAGIANRGVNLGRQLTPLAGGLSNELFGEGRNQTGNFAQFLNDPQSRAFYKAMSAEATADLSNVEAIAENALRTVENVARASRPFFHEGIQFLQDWTGGWKESTNDLQGTRQQIGGFVDQLKSWGHLGGAGFSLIQDLLAPAAGSGQTMVDDLTKQLEIWDDWINRNPRQVKEFFRDSAQGTERIASALGKITGGLWKAGQLLAPLLEQASQLVTVAGNAGLLSPAGLPLLLAGGAGVRNVTQGVRGRIRGGVSGSTGSMGGAPLILGGGAGTRFGAYGTSRFGSPLGRSELGLGYGLERESGRGILGAASSTARATKVGGAVESFGRGALSRLGPLAVLSGVLGGLGTPGDFWERVQGGFSQASFGAIAPPATGDQKYSSGYRGALQSLQNNQIVGHHLGLGREERWDMELRQANAQRHYQGTDPSLQGAAAGYAARASDIRSRQNTLASGALGDITGGFGIRTRHGVDPQDAFAKSAQAIESRASTMHGRTSREFSQMSLDWAKSMARSNPKLQGLTDELAQNIERRMNSMGEAVQVIHGRIVDVSERSWSKVREIIGTQTQLALSEANTNLTALEQRAFSILKGMGYNATEAQSLVHEAQTGKPTKAGSAAGASAHHHGAAGATVNNMPPSKHAATGNSFRLPMPASGSMQDVLDMGGGNRAAGGEVLIGNRHTERKVDRLLAPYGTTLGREIQREGRAHSEGFRHFATGGRTKPGWRGISPGGLHQGIKKVASSVLGQFPGLSVTSTTGGSHVSGSLHYAGEAVDLGGDTQTMFDASAWIKRSGIYRQLTEGIHNPNLSVSDGHFVDPSFYSAVWAGHADHIHLGVAHAVGQILSGMRGGGFGGGTALGKKPIHLQGNKSRLGGIPGAASQRGNDMVAAGMSKRLTQLTGGGRGRGGGGAHMPGGGGGGVEAQIARVLFAHGANKIGAAGIIGNAVGESGSPPDPGAVGTGGGGLFGFTSGAVSLAAVQAAAARAGVPWDDAKFQTEFMLRHGGQSLIPKLNAASSAAESAVMFMDDWERPGIPRQDVREAGARAAFSHGYATGGRRPGFAGWYGRGGHFRVKNPMMVGVGENGPEDVKITPVGRGGGGRPIQVNVDLRGSHIGNSGDAQKLGREAGQAVAKELADALESSDGVKERALTG